MPMSCPEDPTVTGDLISPEMALSVDGDPISPEKIIKGNGNAAINSKPRGTTWLPPDEMLLCKAWLNTWKDPIRDMDHDTDSLWKRVEVYYNEHRVSDQVERKSTQLKAKWHAISPVVNKILKCYMECQRLKQSGMSNEEVHLQAAYLWCEQTGNQKWKLSHAWDILKNEPKWFAYIEAIGGGVGPSKRARINEVGNYSSSSDPNVGGPTEDVEEVLARPMGVEVCNEKLKGKGSSSCTTSEPTVPHELVSIKETLDRTNKVSLMKMVEKYEDRRVAGITLSPTQLKLMQMAMKELGYESE